MHLESDSQAFNFVYNIHLESQAIECYYSPVLFSHPGVLLLPSPRTFPTPIRPVELGEHICGYSKDESRYDHGLPRSLPHTINTLIRRFLESQITHRNLDSFKRTMEQGHPEARRIALMRSIGLTAATVHCGRQEYV